MNTGLRCVKAFRSQDVGVDCFLGAFLFFFLGFVDMIQSFPGFPQLRIKSHLTCQKLITLEPVRRFYLLFSCIFLTPEHWRVSHLCHSLLHLTSIAPPPCSSAQLPHNRESPRYSTAVLVNA